MSRYKTVSVVEAVAQEVRDLVLDGVVRPGERLGEAERSKRYRVGRQTFRAAAQVLCQQGVLTKSPNRGFFVPQLDKKDIQDLFRVRALLELEAVRTVLASGAVPVGAELALRDMSALDNDAPWRAVVDADQRFHRALIDACDSPRLVRAYESVESEVMLSMVSRPDYSRADHAAEHGRLLQLLRGSDVKAAEIAYIEHFRVAEANVIRSHLRVATADVVGAFRG